MGESEKFDEERVFRAEAARTNYNEMVKALKGVDQMLVSKMQVSEGIGQTLNDLEGYLDLMETKAYAALGRRTFARRDAG